MQHSHFNVAPLTDAPRYFLGPLVFACGTRHGAILLDLLHDRYIGFGRADATALSRRIDDFPDEGSWASSSHEIPLDPGTAENLLNTLLAGDLLSTSAPSPNHMVSCPISLHGALVSIGDEVVEKSPATLADSALFLWCLAKSIAALRCVPLRRIVYRVHRRRAAALASGYRFNLENVARQVYAFRSIRPYFFLAKDHCLIHALTLIDYLAHNGEFPSWVFGVSMDPWTAHTWVQHEDFLLDCTPENVCSLEPILSI